MHANSEGTLLRQAKFERVDEEVHAHEKGIQRTQREDYTLRVARR